MATNDKETRFRACHLFRHPAAPNVSGTAQITIVLVDDGGAANGGSDRSEPQTFMITVTKLHWWHNAINGLDVNADGHIVAGDALAVINQINAFGPGPVPRPAPAAPPYYDVTGDDHVAPDDALAIINHINAFGSGEGEPTNSVPSGKPVLGDADLLNLLAVDLATQPKRRL